MCGSDSFLVSGHKDGALRFWNLKNGNLIHEIKDLHSEAVTGITCSNDNTTLLTTS